ncbi:MAG: XRE family transcriptional regulator [Gammaproteobacteria bacterium]|nr:XRE family transcriptional regulator [Gammaproteobacteria bacterium]
MSQTIQYTEGSGNIYQDLGLSNAEKRLAKAELAIKIEKIIQKRKLRQIEAARILGISQPKVSALMNGDLKGFSIERLLTLLTKLNQDIEIVVKSRRGSISQGHLRVA